MKITPEIRLQLVLVRAKWQRLLQEALLEHQAGTLTSATMDRVEAAEREHRELHAAILEVCT
jgi:hypothetical protein